MYAYVAGTPFAYITFYHVPAQSYGLLFGLGIIGIMAANIMNTRLIPRFGYDRLLLAGTIFTALSAVVAAVAARTGWGGLWGLVVSLFMFASTTGFVVANSITGALSDFPERAGAVSALIGAIQYGSGIVGSGLVGAFADGTPWPMGWAIGSAGIGSLLSMSLLKPQGAFKRRGIEYAKSYFE
jgi:DHA1 family bicyclomycin/chloramphenicol resistance-like MFS transporter